jgi:hypothetical protein
LLTLSWDQLLPVGHPNRESEHFIVTACHWCNTLLCRFFAYDRVQGFLLDSPSPEELVTRRKLYLTENALNTETIGRIT